MTKNSISNALVFVLNILCGSNSSTPKKSVKLEPRSSDTELYRKLKDTLNRTSSSDADASTEAEKTESNGLDAVLDKFEDFCYACI